MAYWIKPNLPPERWRPIAGLDGSYEASSHGYIRQIMPDGKCRNCPKEWRANKNTYGGRSTVYVRRAGKSVRAMVSRLVWEAFKGTVPDGKYLTHISSDMDDSIWNLRLSTKAEISSMGRSKRLRRVWRVDQDGNIIEAYDSCAAAGRELGYTRQTISAKLLGHTSNVLNDGTMLVYGDSDDD